MDYPQEILDKLVLASQRTTQTIDEIKRLFEDEFKKITELGDDQFKDDIERLRYCIQIFWVKYVTRPPVKPHSIIPLGYSRARTSKAKGSTSRRLYVFDSDRKIHPIVVYENQFPIIDNLTPFSLYQNVQLGEYNDGITYTIDDRANFATPDMVEASPREILQAFQFPTVDIKDIEKNLSKRITTSTGSFLDELDWKVIKGTIQRVVTNKDKTMRIGYYVSDFSVIGKEPKVLASGRKREAGIMIWMDEKLMSADQFDECEFFGPVDKREPSEEDSKDPKKDPPEPAMNAFVLLKVHGK